MGSSRLYGVWATHTDPEDLPYFNYVGARKTLAGAQGLAEKTVGRRLHGYFRQSDGSLVSHTSLDKLGAETPHVRIEEGWYDEDRAKKINAKVALPPGTRRG
jgi:hypothetical protein